MAMEEIQRGGPGEPAGMPEGLRRFLWGVAGAVIAFVLWFRVALAGHALEPDWMADGLGRGLILGAYFGMASWRGRRERLARGAKVFATLFVVVMALHAVRGLFTG